MKPNLLIVGASSGIGAALVERLSDRYRILALGRRRERLDALASEEAEVVPVPFDAGKLEEIDPLMRRLVAEYGPLRGLIYCAGLQTVQPVRMLKPDTVRELFAVNTLAPIFFARSFASRRHHEMQASILCIGSVAGEEPEKGIVAYSASKAALHNLVKGLAKELAPIRVNAIAPGFLRTEMTEAFPHVYDESFLADLEARTPLGIVEVGDVADLAEFLLGEGARKISGQIVKIDGGYQR